MHDTSRKSDSAPSAFSSLAPALARNGVAILSVVVALAVAIPVTMAIKGRKISHLEKEVSELQGQLKGAQEQRDADAAKLAPFVAIADKFYGRAPAEKRLGLLANDSAAILLQKVRAVNAAATASRLLKPQELKAIQSKLDFSEHINVRVICTGQTAETLALARQIALLFKGSGFNVVGVDVIHNMPGKGVSITIRKPLKSPLDEGVNLLFTQLEQEPALKIGKGTSDADMEIVVAEK